MNAYDNVLKHGSNDIIPMVDHAKIINFYHCNLMCDIFLTTMKIIILMKTLNPSTISLVQFTPPFVFFPSTTLVT